MINSLPNEKIRINAGQPMSPQIQAQQIIIKIDQEFQKRQSLLKRPESTIIQPFTVSIFFKKPGAKGCSYSVPLPQGCSQNEFDNLSARDQKTIVLKYALEIKNLILQSHTKDFILEYNESQASGPWKNNNLISNSSGNNCNCQPVPIHCDPSINLCGNVQGDAGPCIISLVAFACIFCVIPACIYGSYLGVRACVFNCVECATTRDRKVDGWELVFTVNTKSIFYV